MDPEFGKSFARETWTLYAIGMLGATLRTTARVRRLSIRGLQIDDYIMLFAMVWYTILCVSLNNVASGGGSNYMSAEEVAVLTPALKAAKVVGSKWAFVSEHAYNITLWSFKTCMLMLYFRLASRLSLHLFVKICAAYIALTFVASEITLFSFCRPMSQLWAVPPEDEQCATYEHYEIVQGVLSISGDALMLMIAVPILIQVNLPTKQKMILVLVFGMGIFIIVAGVLTKIYCLVPGLVSYVYMNWYFREATISMLVTSLPLVWSLIREVFPRIDSWVRSTSNKTPSKYRSTGNAISSHPKSRHDIALDEFDRLESQGKTNVTVGSRKMGLKDDLADISDDDKSDRALRIRQDIAITVEYEGARDGVSVNSLKDSVRT